MNPITPSLPRVSVRSIAVAALLVAHVGEASAESDHGSAGRSPSSQSVPKPSSSKLPSLSETLSGSAKDDYAAARLLYDDGDFSGALVKFKSAYDASKDPRLLWDAATCEKSLRLYAKAVALVTRYLEAGAPSVTPEAQTEAQAFLDAVKPLTATIAISSNQPGARVYIDDEQVGTTPMTSPILVDIGSQEIAVRKDGFEVFHTVVEVSGPRAFSVDANLHKIVHQGRLVVRAAPGDVISLDGHGVGSGSWETVLPSGGHDIRVTANDKRAFQEEVLIQDGQSRTVDVTLEAASKSIPTWVWIVGSAVVVAGAATAGYFLFRPSDTQTPATVGTLQPGTVQLSLTR